MKLLRLRSGVVGVGCAIVVGMGASPADRPVRIVGAVSGLGKYVPKYLAATDGDCRIARCGRNYNRKGGVLCGSWN